jgi:CheY-like chemotaxis protein
LTGYGQRTDRELALSAGFDEHVVKPVDLVALRRLLDSRRSARPSTDGALSGAREPSLS